MPTTEFAMTRTLPEEAQEDLQSRGYSRRDMARLATVFGVGAMAASVGRPAWASGGIPDPAPSAKTRIGANECWTGPLIPGRIAAQKMVEHGNRYSPADERGDFIKAVMAVEGVPYDHVAPWPGSSDPLSRAVVSYCSPTKGLVTANPTFELAGRTAEWLGAPVKRVPLTKDFRHDVKAMLAVDPNAGLYYICTPNNPTGTITPLEDIEWLIQHKPEGSMVLVDEAYTHFAGVPVASSFAPKYKDVIVMRTFSKIFGMAGLRMGFIMTQPANIGKMMRYDGGMQSGALPLALASVRHRQPDRHTPDRRAQGRDGVGPRFYTRSPQEARVGSGTNQRKHDHDRLEDQAGQIRAGGLPRAKCRDRTVVADLADCQPHHGRLDGRYAELCNRARQGVDCLIRYRWLNCRTGRPQARPVLLHVRTDAQCSPQPFRHAGGGRDVLSRRRGWSQRGGNDREGVIDYRLGTVGWRALAGPPAALHNSLRIATNGTSTPAFSGPTSGPSSRLMSAVWTKPCAA